MCLSHWSLIKICSSNKNWFSYFIVCFYLLYLFIFLFFIFLLGMIAGLMKNMSLNLSLRSLNFFTSWLYYTLPEMAYFVIWWHQVTLVVNTIIVINWWHPVTLVVNSIVVIIWWHPVTLLVNPIVIIIWRHYSWKTISSSNLGGPHNNII